MATTVREQLDSVHPQMLRVRSEGDRKKVADLRRDVGRVVERTFELMGISKQDAAFRMGYRDAGVVSRWCSGAERPLLDKLLAIDGFEESWLVALAERSQTARVETTVHIPQRRTS